MSTYAGGKDAINKADAWAALFFLRNIHIM